MVDNLVALINLENESVIHSKIPEHLNIYCHRCENENQYECKHVDILTRIESTLHIWIIW